MTNHQIRIARYLVSKGVEVRALAPKFGVGESTLQRKLVPTTYPSGLRGMLTRAEAEAYGDLFKTLTS